MPRRFLAFRRSEQTGHHRSNASIFAAPFPEKAGTGVSLELLVSMEISRAIRLIDRAALVQVVCFHSVISPT